MEKATLQHLRIPFSYFLMPVFLFALSQAFTIDWLDTLLAFTSIHLFLYPASNGYNSYFDKDEESIGGLEYPPKVSRELYFYSLLFDGIALLLALIVSFEFAVLLFIYGLASKAYSHPAIRLKKYPFTSWILAGFFQGCFTYLACIHAISKVPLLDLFSSQYVIPGLLSSAMLMGSYPMTQVYQHREDARRGDFTLSRLLGIRGTFLFTLNFFGLAAIGFVSYFVLHQTLVHALIFLVALLPVLIFFLWWMFKAWSDLGQVNYKNTMRLNTISAHCLNGCFFSLFILSTV